MNRGMREKERIQHRGLTLLLTRNRRVLQQVRYPDGRRSAWITYSLKMSRRDWKRLKSFLGVSA